MKAATDSKDLFIKQVSNHSKTLVKLLETDTQHAIEDSFMEKCILATKMLANSMSLLKLNIWQEFLAAFETLLMKYRNNRSPWDERISQVTSELIEKEELLAYSYEENGDWDPQSAIAPEEIRALIEEVNTLLEMDEWESAESTRSEPREAEANQLDKAISDNNREAQSQWLGEEKKEALLPFLNNLVPQLKAACDRLLYEWDECQSAGSDQSDFLLQKIRKEAHLIDYYALSLGRIAALKKGNLKPVLSTLEPVRLILDDFAAALSERYKRRVDIAFLGVDNDLEVGLLFDTAGILQSMIEDVCVRTDEEYLRIEIEVENRNGCLWWSLRDNGNNFISDSRLDRDDFLAFYPGLKEVRRVLERLRGVLWVEPNEDREKRFVFTTPVYEEYASFVVWGEGKTRFCIPSTQVCFVIDLEEARIHKDLRGETVLFEGKPVPLLRMSFISPEAPEYGNKIVVAGSMEKRLAFYVKGDGVVEEGRWKKETAGSWGKLCDGLLEMGENKIPIISVGALVERYMDLFKSSYADYEIGGVAESQSSSMDNIASDD